MYVHLGGDVIVSLDKIIGCFDLERTTTNNDTRVFLKTAEDEGFVMTIDNEMPKSFIIVETEFRYQVYLSSLSVSTIFRRCYKGGKYEF